MKQRLSTPKKLHNKSGVALLTVLVSILIMSLLTIEFQYSVAIERKLAYSELNQLQAHYLAKSGARFGLLRIVLFLKANKKLSTNELIKQKISAIWSLPLPPFPPATSTIKKMAKADQDTAEKAVEESKISIGQFSQIITNESSKINLNYLIVPKDKRGETNAINFTSIDPPKGGIYEYVARLLYNAINEIITNSDNPVEEFGNIRAEEVVYDIMDWVNPENVAFGNRNKNAYYEQQKPPYKAKRGRFFTLDELKLVRTVEDNLFQKLKPYITVYSYDGKINLNDANKNMLKAIYPEFTQDDLNKITEEKNKIGNWASEKSFVDFVTKTLGRNGFRDLYREEKDYPFTVNSYSFVIESFGIIPKSKSVIQKKTKIAVALTTAGGPAATKNVASQQECEQDVNYFWNFNTLKCNEKPVDEASCTLVPGIWGQQNGTFGCEITGYEGAKRFITAGTDGKPKEPNALKILYWIET